MGARSGKNDPQLSFFQMSMMLPTYDREEELRRAGYKHVAGVDEAGRGPLAGPVVAGAAILPRAFAHQLFGQINDSKQLTHRKRVELCEKIKEHASWGLGVVSAGEIDEINIRRASWVAMERALQDLGARFPKHKPDYAMVDGLPCPEMPWPIPYETLIKGDTRSASIAAASIIAKVWRDEFMVQLDEEFPHYGFKQHKGYPTRAHYAALRERGPCEIHRKTFAPVRAEMVRLGLTSTVGVSAKQLNFPQGKI